ncbi:MAG: diguanylate cyclase [Thiovulaceae bacterium]|nr:diguanylate cyclase [Sulfurimonadaceae bacterium]
MRFINILYILVLFSSLHGTEKLQDVSLQFQWKHQFEYAGFYAAKERGFYKDVGLNVTFKEYTNGMNIIDNVISKKSIYGITYSDLIVDYLHGKPIVFLANFFKHSPLILVTQPEIQLPSDLKGKKIMGVQDSLKSTAFLMMFKDFGMDMHSFTNVPPSFNVNDFIDKKVDAMVVFSSNELYNLDKSGIKYHVLNPSSYGTEFYDVNLFTSKEELINHPQRVKNFREASIKGWEYALSHKDEIIDLILKKYNTQHKSREALEFEAMQIQKMVNPTLFKIGSIDKRRVRIMAEDFIEMGLIANDINLDFDDFIYKDINYNTDLSKTEIEYLKAKRTLKLCTDPSWMPFEAIKDNKHVGIAADYFNILRKNSNISMELYPTKSWQESLEAAKNRKCDIFTLASATPLRLKYMDFTDPYIKLPLVVTTTIDKPYTDNFYTLKDKKIGVVTGYAIAEILHSKYPNMQIIEVNNIHEGLTKVENGELYGYIDNLMVIAYTIQHEYTGILKVSSRVNEDVALAIGTRNDEPILHDIFQKLVHNISEKEKQSVFNNWISVEETKEVNYSFLYKILLFVLALSLLYFYRYHELTKYNKKLEKLSTTDVLTGLNNRMKIDAILDFQYKLAKRYDTVFGIMILDIDYFKNINDTYGHQVGDAVLKQFATIIQENIRDTDSAGRWGGEEFMIICPQTEIDALFKVAEHLRETIASHDFSNNIQQLTASFGITCYNGTQDAITLVKEVDSALYTAKESGRNRVVIAGS